MLSQQSTNVWLFLSYNWIQRIKFKKRFQNMLILPCRSAMFWNFGAGIQRYRVLWPMTSLNFISHVCETRKFVMAILHRKQGLLCDETLSMFFTDLSITRLGLWGVLQNDIPIKNQVNPVRLEPRTSRLQFYTLLLYYAVAPCTSRDWWKWPMMDWEGSGRLVFKHFKELSLIFHPSLKIY